MRRQAQSVGRSLVCSWVPPGSTYTRKKFLCNGFYAFPARTKAGEGSGNVLPCGHRGCISWWVPCGGSLSNSECGRLRGGTSRKPLAPLWNFEQVFASLRWSTGFSWEVQGITPVTLFCLKQFFFLFSSRVSPRFFIFSNTFGYFFQSYWFIFSNNTCIGLLSFFQ